MQNNGVAPTADDVPENNELGIMDFLKKWEDSHRNKQHFPTQTYQS